MDVPVPTCRGDLADLTETLINLLDDPISFDEVLSETEKRKMPLKNAPILQCSVIRALIYSIEGSRSQREKLAFFNLIYLFTECKYIGKNITIV